MRLRGAVVLLIACLGSTGCTSKSGLDDMVPRPSNEVTSSISRPVASVPSEAGAEEPQAEEAMAVVPPDRPIAEVKEQELVGQETLGQDTPELPAQMAALAAPERPTAASAAIEARTISPRRFRDAKPINFGKRSPRHLAVHGVDVSRWQGNIDWPKLRSQGANFAYIKATDGGDHLDPMFKKNWSAAAGAGLKRGAYHFFYWCRTAGEQADWFIRNVPKVDGALPPVIDVEWNGESTCKRRPSRAKVLEKMQVFMDRLERHYGQRPMIYTSPDFYRDNLDGAFPDYPFWVRSVAAHPSKLYPGRKWLLWQYSGSGLSHGVEGKVDLNVFHGTEAQWYAWARGGPTTIAEAD